MRINKERTKLWVWYQNYTWEGNVVIANVKNEEWFKAFYNNLELLITPHSKEKITIGKIVIQMRDYPNFISNGNIIVQSLNAYESGSYLYELPL